MTKFTVIVDSKGKTLGAVRSEAFQVAGKKLQFRPPSNAAVKHHEVEISDALVGGAAQEFRKEVERKLASR
jgi:hypothetical protein